jgi:hypothetical protein
MQQFNEVFGNMLEVGREGNSNQFGPLALNEWMRSAQAGTYLRVLGVGNGLPSSSGKTSEAGFVVGEKQLQLQSTGLAKVGDNENAAITDSTAALALGRTHMLGCFMKDAEGSTYLADAGMASEDAAASIVIDFGDQVPEDGSTLSLIADDGDGTFTTRVYGFDNGGGAVANTNHVINTVGGANAIAALLATEIQQNHANLNAVAAANTGRLTITQVQSGAAGNTEVKATLNNAVTNKITITSADGTSITNSTSGATFRFREGTGGTKASGKISGQDAAITDGQNIVIKSPDVTGTEKTVTFTFNTQATIDTAIDNDGAVAVGQDKADAKAAAATAGFYRVAAATGAITVLNVTGGSNAENNAASLQNLLNAINSSGHDISGLITGERSDDDLVLTQVLQGTEGNLALTTTAAAAFTIGGLEDGSGNANVIEGGTAAANANVTLKFNGQPNAGDVIRLPNLNGSTDGEAFHFIATLTGDLIGGLNATRPGGLDDTIGGNTAIAVELGESIDVTLDNLRHALLQNGGADPDNNAGHGLDKDNISVVIDFSSKELKIAADGANGLADNKELIFNVSSNVTVSNPAGESLVGNFGEKTINFSGGETNAAQPVIRGVLMTPQGVRASLEVNDNLGDDDADILVPLKDLSSHDKVRLRAHGKTFGNTADNNLAGYVVGEVDSSQGFKLILNGYSNIENPAVLDCSFDPNSPSYFAKVLNTDPTKMEELGHYLYANWDINPAVAAPSNAGLKHSGASVIGTNYEDMKGFLVAGAAGRNTSDTGKPDYEDFRSKFATARTPWIVSQFYSAGVNTAARPGTAASGGAVKLFRLYSVDDGVISNGKFRLLISNLRYGGQNDYGSFDMSLESFASDPIRGTVVASWKNANLDTNSRNFIGRLVGDKHIYYDFESDLGKQRLREEGQYDRKNPYVRIELSDALKQGDVEIDALPTGFQGHAHLFTKSNGNFLELDVAEGNRVFTDSANLVTETLSQAQVLPLDFVTSINRIEGASSLASDDDLAWGVKFALRENNHISYTDSNGNLVKGHKELTEQVFNKSISSWAKFFPSFGSNPAWITDDAADSSQNSFFSLEKIAIPTASLDTDSNISTWDGATYKRKPADTPSGRFVKISKDALGGNAKYLKFRCMFQGGFDGVNIFDEEKAELSGVASLREGEDETNSQKFTGPTVMAYQRAVDVLTDKSATEFQLLAIPGQRSPRVTDYAITACEDRFDAMLIIDIVEKDALNSLIEDSDVKPHVRNTISLFSDRVLDTSFAAAYFPDVVVRRPSDNAPIVVPPSVGMLGVMSRNDSIADPWFAPAGLNRGRLSAIDSRVQMNRDLLDDLYDADINPIYVPAGRSGEVYAFGQKTLLQDQSALDRINVRRLLIDIRRKVKKVGEQLLFEPNRSSTLSRFSSLVEPIMANVQERRGVTRYKVQIDSSTTTQNDIENNTIRGKIYLQPTKSVEFISLDFVVTNTIQQ